MDLFEFVLAGISIVFGLALTKFLEGIVTIARRWRGRRLYWVHVVWIVNSLLWLCRGWWQLWILRDNPTWDFAEFVLVIVHASTMFIWLPLIVFVDDEAIYPDGKAFYYGIKDDFFRWGIVHFIAYLPFAMSTIASTNPAALVPPFVVWTSLMFVAFKTNRAWFHAGWALLNAIIFVGILLDFGGTFRLG